MEKKLEKPVVKLIGADGNAFAILGKVIQAMKRAGYPESTIAEYKTKATAGDYDHLLAVTMEYVEVE